MCANRERGFGHRARAAESVGDLARVETQQRDCHGSMPPAACAGRATGGLFVPRERSFDAPDVMDLRLHLDDEQGGGPPIERENVDPTWAAGSVDQRFSSHLPAHPDQAPLHVDDAATMDHVARQDRRGDERRPEREFDAHVQRVGDRGDGGDRHWAATALDLRDETSRDPGARGQLGLRPSTCPARVPDGAGGNVGENDLGRSSLQEAEGVWRSQIKAARAYLWITRPAAATGTLGDTGGAISAAPPVRLGRNHALGARRELDPPPGGHDACHEGSAAEHGS